MAVKRKKAHEGGIAISFPTGVFYNPEMELCRDISSLCVGAIGGKLSVADAMCASGVRGLRYRKENGNVKSLALCDLSTRAIACARKNAAENRVRCRVVRADANGFLRRNRFDLVDLDPFGSPAPFLDDAIRSFEGGKGGFLSVTATDMAVLCGAAHAACMRNYGAVPLDNEFCHENAVRILLGKITLVAAPFNFGIRPLLSFSHRHYVKVVVGLSRGSDAAVQSVKALGFAAYCPQCCWRETKRLSQREKCPHCGHLLQIAGPLYLGQLWNGQILEKMLELNAGRGYAKKGQIEKILRTMADECRVGGFAYYDLHTLAKKHKAPIKSMDDALEALHKAGFAAVRTHFCPTAIRTDAPHGAVVRMVKG